MNEKKKIGRPTKPAAEGARASLGLRVTSDLKSKLDAAAEASGRSQSQEAEFRLERSFAEDAHLPSPELRSWAYLMAGTFAEAGRFEARMRDDQQEWRDGDWMRDPQIYRSAMFSVIRKLIREMPRPNRGDVTMYLSQIAAQFHLLEGELLGTGPISGFVKRAEEDDNGAR